MILIEFQQQLKDGNTNLLKYRNIDDQDWYYMYIDIETIHRLVSNFGIISTVYYPSYSSLVCGIDNPSTGTMITASYCGAEVKLYCANQRIYTHALRSLAQQG